MVLKSFKINPIESLFKWVQTGVRLKIHLLDSFSFSYYLLKVEMGQTFCQTK